MMKKKIMLLLFVISGLNLVSCADEVNSEYQQAYTVIWQNYNGDILEIDRNVKEGSLPSYDSEEPTRRGNSYTNYKFNGWDKEIKEVYQNITYTALFSSTYLTYTITWVNENGDVLEIDEDVPHGTKPNYDGEIPTKENNEQYSYVFENWSPEVIEATKDFTYVAQYKQVTNTYTITWTNENGDVLEIDNNVPYGTMPSYDSASPTKQDDTGKKYIFSGWNEKISSVTGNKIYVATFKELDDSDWVRGINPVLSSDGKYVEYGFYPQTHVNNESLIAELEQLTPSINNWVLYENEFYVKEKAKVYNNENYIFSNGTEIVQGNEYWFKCEPIKWNVLEVNDGKYRLLSEMLLDTSVFYKDYNDRIIDDKTIYSNNYEYSDIRSWLNNDFYNTAFALNNTYINMTIVDNTSSTTEINNNSYCGNNTEDKVYLPSYQDYLNSSYGFSNGLTVDKSREAKTTDFARIRGAWCNMTTSLKYNSSYWTRSPSSKYYYVAWNVNSSGYLSEYAVNRDNHCVRPCITISIV